MKRGRPKGSKWKTTGIGIHSRSAGLSGTPDRAERLSAGFTKEFKRGWDHFWANRPHLTPPASLDFST